MVLTPNPGATLVRALVLGQLSIDPLRLLVVRSDMATPIGTIHVDLTA